MASKYDFIKELIGNKRISAVQRERIIELAAKEIGSDGSLEERVSEIEKVVYKDKYQIKPTILNKAEIEIDGLIFMKDKKPTKEKIESSKEPQYRSPSSLYKFLFEYNQNQVLKSTCHDIDSDGLDIINDYCKTSEYSFAEHRKAILREYYKLEKKYKEDTNYQARALIRGYLTGKNAYKKELTGWSSDNIEVNWSHPDLISWSKTNPGRPPNPNEGLIEQTESLGFEFKRIESKVSGNAFQTFTELVLHFKNLFHIRSDNSLRAILEKKNLDENWNTKVEFEIDDSSFPTNIEHFTDVDKLVQAYKTLIKLIIKNHPKKTNEKPKVKLSFMEKDESKLALSIYHLNGVYGKTVENAIERIGQDYFKLYSKQIYGLCNLYLKADFGQEYAAINLWNGDKRKREQLDTFKGVEHILEFPKK